MLGAVPAGGLSERVTDSASIDTTGSPGMEICPIRSRADRHAKSATQKRGGYFWGHMAFHVSANFFIMSPYDFICARPPSEIDFCQNSVNCLNPSSG